MRHVIRALIVLLTVVSAPVHAQTLADVVRWQAEKDDPELPKIPTPVDGATAVAATSTLAWTSTGATSGFDVYLGPSSSPPKVGTVPTPSYQATALVPSTKYYWKVVAKNKKGTMTGPVWSFTTAGAPPIVTPPPSSTDALFEDFSTARVNGDGTPLTQAYTGEDPGNFGAYDTVNGWFRNTVAGGNNGAYVYLSFVRNFGYLFSASPVPLLKSYIRSGGPLDWTAVNRLSFYVRPSVSAARRPDGGDIFQVGTYVRDHGNPDSAQIGAHYYHLFDPNLYANHWHLVVLNRTPQHLVGQNPSTNWGDNPQGRTGVGFLLPDGYGSVDYFDGLTNFYFDTQDGVSWAANSTWDFAAIALGTTPSAHDAELSSFVAVYSGTAYELSWAGLKNTPRTYEVRTSTSSMIGPGFLSGTDRGTVTNPGSAYTGCFFSFTSPELPAMYVAVRVQGQTEFEERYIPAHMSPTNRGY